MQIFNSFQEVYNAKANECKSELAAFTPVENNTDATAYYAPIRGHLNRIRSDVNELDDYAIETGLDDLVQAADGLVSATGQMTKAFTARMKEAGF